MIKHTSFKSYLLFNNNIVQKCFKVMLVEYNDSDKKRKYCLVKIPTKNIFLWVFRQLLKQRVCIKET